MISISSVRLLPSDMIWELLVVVTFKTMRGDIRKHRALCPFEALKNIRLAWHERESPQKTLASWWQRWAEWREGGKEEDVLSSGSRCPILSLCRCRWTGCTLPRTWNVCQILESLWYNYLIQDITAKIQDNLIRFLNPLASGNLTWITLLQLGRQGYPLG